MSRLILLLLLPVLAACGPSVGSEHVSLDRPMRIVSLDYCADQYVLKLADPDQILALSPHSEAGFSYMRDAARGVPKVRPIAEDVLLLKPDLVVRSYGGGPNAVAFFERAGVPVLQVGWASQVDGKTVGSIPGVIEQMAEGLGQPEKGQALIAEFRERLAVLRAEPSGDTVLYVTPSGYTSGPGSLIHDMFRAAGLENFQQTAGWQPLPLERLAYDRPDRAASTYFEKRSEQPDHWSASRHPVVQNRLAELDVVTLQGAWTSCGGWFILEAIEAMAAGGPQ